RGRGRAEERRAEQQPGDHLANHRRLAEAAERDADRARGGDDDDRLQEKSEDHAVRQCLATKSRITNTRKRKKIGLVFSCLSYFRVFRGSNTSALRLRPEHLV